MTPDRETVAYHEAGHAVTNAVLGVYVQRVWIAAEFVAGEKLGQCELPHPDDPARELIGAVAGPIAQLRHDPDSPNHLTDADTGDWERVKSLVAELPQAHRDNGEQNAIRVANRILDDYWPAVCRVAALLLRDGVVIGDVVEAIVARCRSGRM